MACGNQLWVLRRPRSDASSATCITGNPRTFGHRLTSLVGIIATSTMKAADGVSPSPATELLMTGFVVAARRAFVSPASTIKTRPPETSGAGNGIAMFAARRI